jgi:hypothetical protein
VAQRLGEQKGQSRESETDAVDHWMYGVCSAWLGLGTWGDPLDVRLRHLTGMHTIRGDASGSLLSLSQFPKRQQRILALYPNFP